MNRVLNKSCARHGLRVWKTMIQLYNKFIIRWLVVVLVFLMTNCLNGNAAIKAGEATVNMGSTATISLATTYQTTLRSSTIQTYRWSTTSTNVSITSQSAYSCTIKGLNAGTAQVNYYCSYLINGYYRTMDFYYTVTINSGTATLTISPTSITLDEGDTYSVTAYQPGYVGGVYFTSNNSSIASVSTDNNSGYYTYGTVTAKSEGTTYIYAKSANGATSTACTVTVRTKVVKPTSILVTPGSKSIEEGEYTSLSAVVSPSNATYTLTWSSSDTDVATVTSSGRVYGKKAGTARITAKVDGYSLSDYCLVTVTAKQVLVTSFSVDVPTEMCAGETCQLFPTYIPDNATVDFSYTSDNPNVVNVSSSGLLSAVSTGTANITVTENFSQLKKSVEIVVSDSKRCAKPTIAYINGKLSFKSETDGVEFHYDIKDSDVGGGIGSDIDLSVTYSISVYATREGYTNSETTTATLSWIDAEPNIEGMDENTVHEIEALPAVIQTQGSSINIQGVAEGTPISIYGIDGKKYGTAIAEKDQTTINTSLQPGTVTIVKIGGKAVKVLM